MVFDFEKGIKNTIRSWQSEKRKTPVTGICVACRRKMHHSRRVGNLCFDCHSEHIQRIKKHRDRIQRELAIYH